MNERILNSSAKRRVAETLRRTCEAVSASLPDRQYALLVFVDSEAKKHKNLSAFATMF